MSSTIVRKFERNEWPIYRDLRLRALADSPHAFGRTHAEEKDLPDQHWSSRLEDWLASELCLPLLALTDKPSGLSFARLEGDAQEVVHLYSMWVDPHARRHGVGAELVQNVLSWSRVHGASKMVLRVTENNLSAIGLYERFGLKRSHERTMLREGSPLFAVTMELKL